jgi:hypothetical protein
MKKIRTGLELQEREIKSCGVGSPKGAEEPGSGRSAPHSMLLYGGYGYEN